MGLKKSLNFFHQTCGGGLEFVEFGGCSEGSGTVETCVIPIPRLSAYFESNIGPDDVLTTAESDKAEYGILN